MKNNLLENETKGLLACINSPFDLKKIKIDELELVAKELREMIIEVVQKNGGHFAPNLGAVDLIVALHRVYNSPEDKIVFDVGHQAYAHKILTGRRAKFRTIRKKNGLSGYLRVNESEHDAFGAGHVGTAVSAALGLAEARDIKGEKNKVIAVIGDGSLTNGLTYEGLNNAGSSKTDITVVLNDNNFAISKNKGGIAKYLEKVWSSETEVRDAKELFEALGFSYFGPIDGHNISLMIKTFEHIRDTDGPKIVHVQTKKGHGYEAAELNPGNFHFIGPVNSSNTMKAQPKTYSKIFGEALNDLAKENKNIVAITAAMELGTGLTEFSQTYPDRFFDVGIAEEHAVTFAAGLAMAKLKPVVAVYSSFIQRAYDQIIHDVALQNLNVVFCLDRAGIGTDGPTHHGLFDISLLRNIPNIIFMAPKDEKEFRDMIHSAVQLESGPVIIRYPRGFGTGIPIEDKKVDIIETGKAERLRSGNDAVIIAIGSMVNPALKAAKKAAQNGCKVAVYNARFIKPLDESMIKYAAKSGKILTVEENELECGFGSAIIEKIHELDLNKNIKVKRIGTRAFIEHGDDKELKNTYGLSDEKIYEKLIELIKG